MEPRFLLRHWRWGVAKGYSVMKTLAFNVFVIGRAGASPPSRVNGAPLYNYIYINISIYVIWRYGILVPASPRTMRKCKAGLITSSYLVKSWTPQRVTSKPLLVCCDSRFGLPLSLTSSTLRAQLPFAASLHLVRAS